MMDAEGEAAEEALNTGAEAWTTATYQTQELNNVVHIIVPDLSCIQQGQTSDSLATALSEVANSQGALVTHGDGAPNHERDPLSALAAAAELDQVRNDVTVVEHMIEESKYSHETKYAHHLTADMNAGDQTGVSVITEESDPMQHENDQMHHSVVVSLPLEEKVVPMVPLPLAPFLSPDDPDVMFYNEVFHYLNSGIYPDGSTEVYKKVIKKRATNYVINEKGSMSYGHKVSKQVITNREEQLTIIEREHVDKATGVHFGVKKMYGAIFIKFYWRTMYVDVGNYCRHCEKCTEVSVSPSTAREYLPVGTYEESFDDTQRITTLPTDRIIRVWKKVQLQIYGPYNRTMYGNEVLITIVDPFSKWIVAQPSPVAGVEVRCANFIFDTFCQFGFAQCHVIGMSSESFEHMQACYRERFEGVQEVLRTLVPFDSEDAQQSFLFTLQEESLECSWAGEMFEHICAESTLWDQEVNRYLFQFHTTHSSPCGVTPFNLMFARNPTGYVSEEEKENINILEEEKALQVPAKRRRLQSSTLQCRHCYETFTSKISFRIHQRKHTEEARKRGTMDGEERLRLILQEKKPQTRKIVTRKKRRPFGRGSERLMTLASSDWSDSLKDGVPNDESRQQLTNSTVAAVKALLNATKEERSKRGKYVKYTPELRDEIAQYALSHGNQEAMGYFSQRLGGTVSESTIRNFIKTYKSYTTDIKDEIGKYAFEYGIDASSRHFSERLGHDVRKGLVRTFKKNYVKKYPEVNDVDGDVQIGNSGKRIVNVPSSNAARQKRSFSLQMKDEIGRYASQYGITAAMQHFTEKLQFAVKESTVRKFKKQFVERNNINGSSNVENTGVVNSGTVLTSDHQTAPAHTIDVLHPSLSVLNAPAVSATVNVSSANNFVYQHPYHLNMAPGPQTNAVVPMNHNSLTFHQGGVINQGMTTSLPYQQPGAPPGSSVIMNQSFTQTPTGFQQGYVGGFSQGGSAGGTVAHGGQIAPLAMTHSSIAATSMAHSPLPLTMSGVPTTHIPQLTHHSVGPAVSQPHITQTAAIPHSVTTGVQHPAHHQLITSFPQPLTGSLSFDGTTLQAHTQANLSNEPLSLMKETHDQSGAVTLAGQGDDSLHDHGTDAGAAQSGIGHLAEQTGPPSQPEVILTMDNDEDYTDIVPPRKKRLKGRTKITRCIGIISKRGNYASYSPELRAEIGKYASEFGNLAAVQHFKEKVGFEIPESTVRGLRDKYLIKRVRGKKEVHSIGFAQRGRPMRLGKYDEIVQDCIRELVKDGEKVSSFLAIATAKQVLMQYEPNLLEEYGGPVKLNPTWAKSFLKRIGLHQLA